MSSNKEQAGETLAGHVKRKRHVLKRGACRRDPSRSHEVAKASPRMRSKRTSPKHDTRSGKGLSSKEEHAGKTPIGHAKQQRLVHDRRKSRRDPCRSREAAKACQPRLVARSRKDLSLPEEQVGATPAGRAKRKRLVLAQGTCKRDTSGLRVAARACPCPRNNYA